MKTPLAIFDFDGTLVRGDSFIKFAIHCRGRLGFLRAFVRSLPWLVGWKLGIVSNSSAKQRLFSYLYAGMEYGLFKDRANDFCGILDNDINPTIYAEMMAHKNAGHRVAVVSASIRQWLEPWCIAHGITDVIATQPELSADGKSLTGRFATPNCHGPEKVSRLKEHFGDLDRYEIWAYGDSSGDDAMLSVADHPVRVQKS